MAHDISTSGVDDSTQLSALATMLGQQLAQLCRPVLLLVIDTTLRAQGEGSLDLLLVARGDVNICSSGDSNLQDDESDSASNASDENVVAFLDPSINYCSPGKILDELRVYLASKTNLQAVTAPTGHADICSSDKCVGVGITWSRSTATY